MIRIYPNVSHLFTVVTIGFLLCIAQMQMVEAFDASIPQRSTIDLSRSKNFNSFFRKLPSIEKKKTINHYSIGLKNYPSKSLLLGAMDSMYTKRVGSKGGGQPNDMKSKRQERLNQLVSAELGRIIHSGHIKGRDVDYISDALRRRISVVKSDVSPDLRQARVSVSIRSGPKRSVISDDVAVGKNNMLQTTADMVDDENDDESYESTLASSTSTSSSSVDKREAYSWLVSNTKSIRHTLAQKMSHMKVCPTLTFVQVDVAAAVDVMYLIDQVVSGKKRNDLPFQRSSSDEINWDEWEDDDDDDDEDDEGEWDVINKDFLKTTPR